MKSAVMARRTSASRNISAVPVEDVSSAGARIVGRCDVRLVRCGFRESAVSSAACASGSMMR